MVTLTPRLLAMFHACPAQYRRYIKGELPEKKTRAQVFGLIAHGLLLTGKAPEVELKLTPLERDHLANMFEAFRAHKLAQGFLKQPQLALHIPICATLEGRACEANIDCLDKDGDLFELKTTSDITRFERFDVHDLGYVYELAFKRMLLRAVRGTAPEACFICAAEKSEPYRVGVFAVANNVLADAEARVRLTIQAVTAAEQSDNFPTFYEDFRTISTLK